MINKINGEIKIEISILGEIYNKFIINITNFNNKLRPKLIYQLVFQLSDAPV